MERTVDLAPAGYVTDACLIGEHEPNADGTACYYCELPSEPVTPDDLAAAWGRVAAGLPED